LNCLEMLKPGVDCQVISCWRSRLTNLNGT